MPNRKLGSKIYRFLGSDTLSLSCSGKTTAFHTNVHALHTKPKVSYKMKRHTKKKTDKPYFLS